MRTPLPSSSLMAQLKAVLVAGLTLEAKMDRLEVHPVCIHVVFLHISSGFAPHHSPTERIVMYSLCLIVFVSSCDSLPDPSPCPELRDEYRGPHLIRIEFNEALFFSARNPSWY